MDVSTDPSQDHRKSALKYHQQQQTTSHKITDTTTMLLAGCIILTVLGVACGQIADTTVAFMAAVDGDLELQNGNTLVLKKTLINFGSGYNDQTGIFTAPKSGIYQFQVHALATSFWLCLYHNDSYVISAFARQSDYDAAGNSAILRLKKGDRVQLKVRGKAFFYGRPDDIYTTFSGHRFGLLREGDSS